MVPKMLDKARRNLSLAGIENATFQEASAEDVPFPDEHFDVVISNGAFNLIPGKTKGVLIRAQK